MFYIISNAAGVSNNIKHYYIYIYINNLFNNLVVGSIFLQVQLLISAVGIMNVPDGI